MEIKSNKIIYLINVCLLCAFVFVNAPAAHAARKTSGTDENGNSWGYDKKTKTLTFSGNKAIEDAASMDGHGPEPSWYIWQDDTEHLVIEDGITGVGEGAFEDFLNLKTVKTTDSITYFGSMSFANCGCLTNLYWSVNLNKLGSYVFSGCRSLEKVQLYNRLIDIGYGAFDYCESIKQINIPDSVRNIGTCAFSYCNNLRQIKLPSGITYVKDGLFFKCKKLKKIAIPSKVETVTMSAFSGTGIKKLVIPKNVKVIKKEYPVLENKVFSGNKKLRKITIKSRKIKKIAKGAFSGLGKSCVIEVPKGKKKKYTKMLRKSGLSKKVKIK